MGISGLLPALKPIQVTKHLSEFEGKSLAVDAYVWLHKGVFACATELATGKSTHKYVDYAMHRVRLLRHHHIEPYVVFDGGPLPAKKGTEKDRKAKRDESLARGNALAAQGKHSQAREYYIKCVDVTPQMAYQFIKALKAEGVSYIVAPYEADAQLAYLERTGLVDGIITEDSDLLVFGCNNVLFKLDSVANTIISISRSDFASICDSNATGISLLGWSDVQFRAMAILSGCDYLPSIPGIGLKTACSMLRKWKTVEQVVRVIALEGKRKVPAGYLGNFRMAERCFLHQRVYCPKQERLVHLTEVEEEWDGDSDAYVGANIEASLAKKVALGDADPITLLPMVDINPGFKPRALKPIPFVANGSKQSDTTSSGRTDKGKGKAQEQLVKGGLHNFFGPNPSIPPRLKATAPLLTLAKHPIAGKASGKRTLADVMDHDLAEKKKRSKHRESAPVRLTESKFFASPAASTPRAASGGHRIPVGPTSAGGPSRLREEKENVYIMVDDSDEAEDDLPPEAEQSLESELDGSQVSMKVQCSRGEEQDMDVDLEEPSDTVEQEDGYISPTPSCSLDTQDLSSPIQPRRTPTRKRSEAETVQKDGDDDDDADFGADILSSPMSAVKLGRSPPRGGRHVDLHHNGALTPTRSNRPVGQEKILANDTPLRENPDRNKALHSPPVYVGPDLRSFDLSSEIDCFDEDRRQDTSGFASPPTPSPETPLDDDEGDGPLVIDVDVFVNSEDEYTARTKAVMDGWKEKWALGGNRKIKPMDHKPLVARRPAKLRRSGTNVTPAGRHMLTSLPAPPRSVPKTLPGQAGLKRTLALQPRRSLPFFDAGQIRARKTPRGSKQHSNSQETIDSSEDQVEGSEFAPDTERAVISRARVQLAQFRSGF